MQYAIHSSTKIYKGEIILLFSFLAYFLSQICGLNMTVVAHRSWPSKSLCAVSDTNTKVTLCTKKVIVRYMYAQRRGSKGDCGAGPNTYAAKQLSFSSSDGKATLGPAYACAVCSGWGANLTE